LKIATFTANGRTSYGAVVAGGIVDLGKRLKYASVLDVLRAGALAEARKAADATPDIALKDVTLKRPIEYPEKILCIGVNYGNRHAEYKDNSEAAKYPSMFFRTPGSFVGSGEPLVKPSVTQQFDYEGEIALVIGKEGRRIAKEKAHEHIAGYTLCNEGTAREWTRHSKFNVTQGKNFDASGKAAAPDDEGERRIAPGRHHRQPAVHLRRPALLCDDLHHAEAGRHHRDRHAGRGRRALRPATMAQGRGRCGYLGSRDRNPKQPRGGRSLRNREVMPCLAAH
jgi:hypothetical protein